METHSERLMIAQEQSWFFEIGVAETAINVRKAQAAKGLF